MKIQDLGRVIFILFLSNGCAYTIPVGQDGNFEQDSVKASQLDERVESGDYRTDRPEDHGFKKSGFAGLRPKIRSLFAPQYPDNRTNLNLTPPFNLLRITTSRCYFENRNKYFDNIDNFFVPC